LNRNYSFPFARHLPFATVLTDYGCPYNCPFCLYSALGFKLRELDNVFKELRCIHDLGVRELFIKDQSFATDKERAIKLCKGLREIGPFSWTCFLRADIADERILGEMKNSGCHTVMFGVESANEKILREYKPGIKKSNIRQAFRLCRNLGIDTVGIFILGFPGEDRQSCLETIDFALELNCDFASFNIFVPKVETLMKKEMTAGHFTDDAGCGLLDQSGIISAWHNELMDGSGLPGLRRYALRKFYLRPAYIMRRIIRSIVSVTELKILFKSGIFIIRDLFAAKSLK
ncbi:MAG: radical SAM protein, partial [Candidatus Omnitrophica bacterium]|nr:radical SAM protein [Candidatus Omnitrophota bacterium]